MPYLPGVVGNKAELSNVKCTIPTRTRQARQPKNDQSHGGLGTKSRHAGSRVSVSPSVGRGIWHLELFSQPQNASTRPIHSSHSSTQALPACCLSCPCLWVAPSSEVCPLPILTSALAVNLSGLSRPFDLPACLPTCLPACLPAGGLPFPKRTFTFPKVPANLPLSSSSSPLSSPPPSAPPQVPLPPPGYIASSIQHPASACIFANRIRPPALATPSRGLTHLPSSPAPRIHPTASLTVRPSLCRLWPALAQHFARPSLCLSLSTLENNVCPAIDTLSALHRSFNRRVASQRVTFALAFSLARRIHIAYAANIACS